MDEIRQLIREKRYFVFHAPRQTGKTSCLLALMKTLNEEGDYTALYVNVEPARIARGDVEAGVASADLHLGERRPDSWAEEALAKGGLTVPCKASFHAGRGRATSPSF